MVSKRVGDKEKLCIASVCMCVCVFGALQINAVFTTCKSLARLQGTMGEIDCEYTILSIGITAKVALQSVKNDLSIPSHKRKYTRRLIAEFSLPVDV